MYRHSRHIEHKQYLHQHHHNHLEQQHNSSTVYCFRSVNFFLHFLCHTSFLSFPNRSSRLPFLNILFVTFSTLFSPGHEHVSVSDANTPFHLFHSTQGLLSIFPLLSSLPFLCSISVQFCNFVFLLLCSFVILSLINFYVFFSLFSHSLFLLSFTSSDLITWFSCNINRLII